MGDGGQGTVLLDSWTVEGVSRSRSLVSAERLSLGDSSAQVGFGETIVVEMNYRDLGCCEVWCLPLTAPK